MLPQVNIEDATGKTIKRVSLGDDLLIVFADDTCARVSVVHAWGAAKIQNNEIRITEVDLNLVDIGIMSQEELEENRRASQERCAADRERREREEYDRLKRKFG